MLKKIIKYVGFSLFAGLSIGAVIYTLVQRRQSATEPLVGILTRQQIEHNFPSWRLKPEKNIPKLENSQALGNVPGGAAVTVYLGTWCADSKRELSRLWLALDMLGTKPPFDIRYIGVDRDKHAPQVPTDLGLRYVPTFVVMRDGREIGRVVESAPGGIEVELKSLLSGEKQGVISGRGDL